MNVCLFGDARSVHLRHLVAELGLRNVAVHVVTHKPASIPGATVERFAVPPPDWRNLRRWRARRRRYLREFLRRFDVANIHFIVDWGFDADDLRSAPVIASAWGSDLLPPPGELPPSDDERAARRTILRAARVVTSCGAAFADVVARFAGLSRDQVQVLPFGVDLAQFHPGPLVPEGPATPERSPIVGFHKGFRPVYGATFLTQATPMIRSRIPDVRFEFIGDGPELEQCQSMAHTLGVDSSIRWLGRLPHEHIADRLRRWSVCVVPSVHEALGVAALEAAASGVPVVASDVCGLRNTVRHGETGLLVPCEDATAITSAVVELLENPARRAAFGRAGRDFVAREYDAAQIYDRWVRVYEQTRERSLVMV